MMKRGLGAFIRGMLFWTLFPLAIPQAIRVRRSAPRLSGAAGPTSGRFGSGKKLRLLAIGDSIIAGVGAATVADALPGQVAAELARMLEREVVWSASGRIGATSSSTAEHLLPPAETEPFDVMVVSVGVNDVTSLKTMSQWVAGLGGLLDDLRSHSPGCVIALMGVPPLSSFPLLPQPLRSIMGIRARAFDDAARHEVTKRRKVLHIPIEVDPGPERFSADGFHPSPASYTELGRQIAAAIRLVMNCDSSTVSGSFSGSP